MKALEILLKTKTAIAVMGQYSLYDLHNAVTELEEAMKPKSCESCSADCSIKDALKNHGQFWDYPCDVGCKSRYEPKENL